MTVRHIRISIRLTYQQRVSQCALFFVLLPLTNSNKAFPTPATPVSVVVCVLADSVPLHVTLTSEPGRTEGTAVWPLSRVGHHMFGKVRPCSEAGRAQLTLKGPHAIM